MADFFEKVLIPLAAALVGGAVGSIMAYVYQKRSTKREEKKYILATLMACRYAGPLNEDFVKCLNMTDIVFHDNKEVRQLLHKYLTYTGNAIYSGGARVEVFFELLLAMGRDIGYKDLTHTDVKDFYVPANPALQGSSDKTLPDKS